MDKPWLKDLFIDEALAALSRHSNTGSGEDEEGQTYVLIDEEGNEIPAIYIGEETIFDATANDIREGKTAVSGDGVVIGTKEIPAYITSEGTKLITAGKPMVLTMRDGKHQYTKLQAIVCAYNTNTTNSVAAMQVCINSKMYNVSSTEALATVIKDDAEQSIDLGIINDSGKPVLVRYFSYKEEY